MQDKGANGKMRRKEMHVPVHPRPGLIQMLPKPLLAASVPEIYTYLMVEMAGCRPETRSERFAIASLLL